MNRPTVPNRVWITALVLWLLPGGIVLSLAYLFYHEVKFDKQASAWSKAMAELAAQMDVLAGDRVSRKFRFDEEGGHNSCANV
jgi:hypothetical protein